MQMLYVTFGDRDEALNVARILLSEKLIACANVVDGTTSIYRWQGEIQQQSEVLLFAKTSQFAQAMMRIKELHSYELPCILELSVQNGFIPFIDWVMNETS